MKNIIAEVAANNQVVLRYVSRPDCLPTRNLGDSPDDIESTYIAGLQKKVERTYAIIRNASIEYLHDNSRRYDVKQDIKDFYGGGGKVGEIFTLERYKGLACTIPEFVEYKEITRNGLEEYKLTPHELHKQREARLDIIKKSQQTKKYERSWGKPQTLKSFSNNAKQKILEAGAVIDKHIQKDNIYELTLTIPGSGYDVYEKVSWYSGYLVNRLTQILRRAEAKGVRVHWFFVWEHQKRGALHMHWCLAVEEGQKIANLLCLELRAKWFSLLSELSVKTGIDLFRKRGFSGTWRHSPDVWQAPFAKVRKSVAAYFSKYCSKNAENREYIKRRREAISRLSNKNTIESYQCRVLSLCPSRYWGASSRTKRLCRRYRVSISFAVSNSREGHYLYKTIRNWIDNLSPTLTEVSRSFTKACPETGFEFARGWEHKIWFEKDSLDIIVVCFKLLFANQERKTDAVGAIVGFDYSLLSRLFYKLLFDLVDSFVYNRVIRDYLAHCMDAIIYGAT